MLIILLPSWAAWILVLLVAVAWVGTWALCRAAALGDEAMFRALESPAQPGVGDEAEPTTCPAPVRLEACVAWEADFLLDPVASEEEEPLVRSPT
jgi:hypothetical protein